MKKKSAITVLPRPDAPLPLPVLRILVKQHENFVVGHCLDFDVYSHYQGDNLKEGKLYVCKEICNMVWIIILDHLEKKTEDQMFNNSLKLGAGWDEFMEILRKERIKQLRSKYDHIKDEIDKYQKVYSDTKKEDSMAIIAA